MTLTTAILINVFLVGGGLVSLVTLLIRLRFTSGACVVATLLGYSLNIFHAASGVLDSSPYVAHPNGGEFHCRECVLVRDAIRTGEPLDPYPTAAAAEVAGLDPHKCVQAKARIATTAAQARAIPQSTPNMKNQIFASIPNASDNLALGVKTK